VFLPPDALVWLNQARLARANATELKAPDRPKAMRKSTEKRKKEGSRSNGHAKRLRASGRNKRGGDSSDESEEERSDSDNNSEEDIENHTSDSVGARLSPNPSENRRPGRDARTRAKAKIKRHVQKKTGRKG